MFILKRFIKALILPTSAWIIPFLLVTSAVHMQRSMMVFRKLAPGPIAAPADFRVRRVELSPSTFKPSESNAIEIRGAINEYIGMVNHA